MENFKSKLSIILFAVLLVNCGQENKSENKTDTLNAIHNSDSLMQSDQEKDSTFIARQTFDSTYFFELMGRKCAFIFSHEVPSSINNGDLSTTLRIVEVENHDTIYKNTFDFNTVGRVEQTATDHFIIDLLNNGGGSGFSGTIFNLRTSPILFMQPITRFSELTRWKSNHEGDKLLVFDGIWNTMCPESSNFESHFSEHRQYIFTYKIEPDTVITTEIGYTKYKYELSENDDDLQKFKKKEPALANKIKWTDFE